MSKQLPAPLIGWRFYFIVFFIACLVVGLLMRLVDLSVFKHSFLLSQGNARATRVMEIPSFRGLIADRNGFPLAISTSVFSAWINPQEFSLNPVHLRMLSKILNMGNAQIQKIIISTEQQDKEFVYLKRCLSPEVANQIKKLKIPGVYFQQEFKRFYPEGEVASHVVGITNIDDHGQEGAELLYDQWLGGVPGKKLILKDRLGREIANIKTLQQQKPGNDLMLSIDKRIQYVAYRELMAGLQKTLAQSGSVVVLDARTGEILAMTNLPSFNPNHRQYQARDSFRNRVVTDVFEPGSTIKPFSVAMGLDSGLFKPETIIDTSPGWIRVGRNIVRDEHEKGPMSVAHILQISSNVGVTKIILSLPPEKLWNLLHNVGFGETTGINFPGERTGVLVNRKKWAPFNLATLSFGYDLSVTPLQLAEAYTIFANGGLRIPVSMIPVTKPVQGIPVLKPKTANQILNLLETVVSVKGGTGILARIPGYRVAGKTGTVRMIGEEGYMKHHHISSFIGIAPVSNPKLIVLVVVNDPQGKNYLASFVAAPIFQKIMEASLRILNIPPDDLPKVICKTALHDRSSD